MVFGRINFSMEEFYEFDSDLTDNELKRIGLELMFMTPEKHANHEGVNAIELAKLTGISVEIVKKKLKILSENRLVRSIGINPKFWKFDEYNFQRMDEDNEVYRLLICFDDVDFERYFQY